MRNYILFVIFILFSAKGHANNVKPTETTILDLPATQIVTMNESNIQFTITNFGMFGEDYLDGQISAVYPNGSNLDYLFYGAIWIGAEVDTIDGAGNPALDTLVTTGMDGW